MFDIPEAEFEPLLRRLLPTLGLHPDNVGQLFMYLPASLTYHCWRATGIEDWHAAGPASQLSDIDMMRANIDTTRIFYQYLWKEIGEWWLELGPYSSEIVDYETLQDLFRTASAKVFDPARKLPQGVTLGELMGERLTEIHDRADVVLESIYRAARTMGHHYVVMLLAFHEADSPRIWWGTPEWPLVIDEFFRLLDDPTHEHWSVGGHPGTPPGLAGDREWFREMLLSTPEKLPTEVLTYCLGRGQLGFIRLAKPRMR